MSETTITISSLRELRQYESMLDEQKMLVIDVDESDAEYEPEGEETPGYTAL